MIIQNRTFFEGFEDAERVILSKISRISPIPDFYFTFSDGSN